MGILDIFKMPVKKGITEKGYKINEEENAQKELISKQNALVDSKYNLSLYELRIFNSLLSRIGRKETEFQEYTIPFKDLIVECNLNRGTASANNYATLKNTIRKLKSRVIEINDDNNEWAFYSLFETARKEHGKDEVVFKISKELKPYLLELKNKFTQLKIDYLIKLSSIFAVRFYEIATKNLHKHTTHWVFILEVAEIKTRFGIEDKYKKYANFKARVLDPAMQEINQKTDIHLEYKQIPSPRNKRKIEKIEFTATRQKDNNQTDEPTKVIEQVLIQKDRPDGIKKMLEIKIAKKIAINIYAEILADIKKKKIKGYKNVDIWFEDFFNNWGEVINNKKTAAGQPIKNIAGFVRTLLDNRMLETLEQAEKRIQNQKKEEAKELNAEKERKLQRIDKHIDEHLEEYHHLYDNEHYHAYINTLSIVEQYTIKEQAKTISEVWRKYKKDSGEYQKLRNYLWKHDSGMRDQIKAMMK